MFGGGKVIQKNGVSQVASNQPMQPVKELFVKLSSSADSSSSVKLELSTSRVGTPIHPN